MGKAIILLPNESDLIANAKTEPAAFAAIYDHYYSRVYNYVHYRIRDSEESGDVTADTFEKILANIHRFRPELGSFATWIFSIARNTVNDYFRHQHRLRWLSLDTLFNQGSEEPQPEDIVSTKEAHRDLLIALTRLNPREQDLLALKFGANLSNFHIAKITGLTQNVVNVSIFRAVRRLRNILDEGK